MHRMKVFCLPYAGGSAAIYSRWKKPLEDIADIIPIELAGRGRRIQETVYDSMIDTVADAYSIISKQIDDKPYALFGHSMGGAIAYEVTHSLMQNGHRSPEVVFFSGRSAPHMKKELEKNVHLYGDNEFIEEILQLGGTPKQLFEEEELKKLFMPLLRADYRIVETYQYKEKANRLNSKVCVFYGLKDETTVGGMEEWNKHTKLPCRLFGFEGGHFFIHEDMDKVLGIIRDCLEFKSIHGV
ncbi:thioesterase [Paenibacillus psychroresistens]|uniref:Thioesterase n=1 Tax=Paenibacillus psychroresistens TaxID=1778678 RepID=A0A6B8RJW0_9BACL|nr:thioesterase domain-containing protein [Paenibacillus psychroresistens]QGQ96117.1 thioesterase [Paenibacillus psychroresistens]